MKAKAAIIFLILVILGLGAALIVLNDNATKEKTDLNAQILNRSNEMTVVQTKLEEQRSVNKALETNLVEVKTDFSNKLSAAEADLATTSGNLAKAQADAKAAAESAAAEMAQRDKKITDLETQNQELDKQSTELRGSISSLETQIGDTQKKLAASEGDREFLMKELKRLQAEKADLERKFNDLAVLRDQVRKLKDELSIARRLDWIRRGIYETLNQKGGERMEHPAVAPSSGTNVGLSVELRQDGGAKITTPPATNAPAAPVK